MTGVFNLKPEPTRLCNLELQHEPKLLLIFCGAQIYT